YSNGGIEGLNNYIKVLKRTAFGFRSFVHFRNRILISKNLVIPIKKYQAESDLQSLSA
ncbi:MAG: transposase, partial [Clostridiales bacterium]|nr:transposase [Clostridiales bacterium]